jgi:threonylcarbamoyladenosine tRNA methylthiotransferase MtaB
VNSSLPNSAQPGFHTITLGCKLNQFDGAAIEGELLRRGYCKAADPTAAQVIVINTCTVTHKADADARRLIRSMRRASPDCSLLVTGCYAEREGQALDAMQEVTRVFGNRDKARLGWILDELGIDLRKPAAPIDRGCDNVDELPQALHFGERSRAFLKIQEGCRLACSYCIIPEVRGPSRSIPPALVEQALARLIAAGYREVVLTGVNTGDYGRDLDPKLDLASLLRRLFDRCGPTRLRLNSLEPLTVTEDIVELLATEPRLASHLQVPLQSGSPQLLRSMRRNYRRDTYVEVLSRLRGAIPDIGLGADVIVGFPGETDALFEETFDFIENSALNYLHVFSWSARPGTPAADYPERVDSRVQRERSRRLRNLADELSLRFRQRFEGRRLDAVALGNRRDSPYQRALTGNFIDVDLPPDSVQPGQPVTVRVGASAGERTLAAAEGFPSWA